MIIRNLSPRKKEQKVNLFRPVKIFYYNYLSPLTRIRSNSFQRLQVTTLIHHINHKHTMKENGSYKLYLQSRLTVGFAAQLVFRA